MNWIDYWYLILVVPALLVALFAQVKVQSTFKKYSQIGTRSGLSGAEASMNIQRQNGIRVPLEQVKGSMTDHYDPRANVIRLSETVYGVRSIAAIGVAAHETGHALVAACQSNSAPVHKITIIPRTSGALGYTMQVEAGERFLMSKEEALNKIATLTGGRAAEEFMFHSITTGASNDIEQATKLARAMVTRYGMSEQFGMVALETVTNQYLGGDTSLACSPETARAIDEEVIKTVKEQYGKAMEILKEHAGKLNELSAYLLEKETITGEEFMEILNR